MKLKTRIDLHEGMRAEVATLLNQNLSTGLDLALQAKQAHWNVKGPSFLQLHELFDTIYAEATAWNDLMAERAVQLGGIAEGTLQRVVERTELEPYSLDLQEGPSHVAALADALAVFGGSVRSAIETADRLGDADTADLFTEISRGADLKLWFLEAHLQAER